MSMTLILLNDTLRLHDNPLLRIADGSNTKAAVMVLNRHAFFGQQYGIKRANLQRLQQQLSVIHSLNHALAARNIGLITLFGDTAQCLLKLAQQLGTTRLYCAEPVATYEYAAIARLSQQLSVTTFDCNSLLAAASHPGLESLPDSFTAFRKKYEPSLQVTPPFDSTIPDEAWLTPAQAEHYSADFTQLRQQYLPQPLHFSASEDAALTYLKHYIWQQRHILHYKDTRNQLIGKHYASFCSPALALGSLSVRRMWHEIERFEQQIMANDSTYWLKFELLWREFFRWQCRKHGASWFSKGGIQGLIDFTAPALNTDQQQHFRNWCSANTGNAFIDANMKLLNQTGLMSNRGRQNVASYLVHDLGIDWRLGAAYFEQRLLDYDCASNWGNWAYIAGTGNSQARQFNVQKQAQLYDPDGSFIRAMADTQPLSETGYDSAGLV